jgi:hypothetical protein
MNPDHVLGPALDTLDFGNRFCTVQGGSDKSGILKLFIENHTAQLKIIRFYNSKKKLAEGHIENEVIQ